MAKKRKPTEAELANDPSLRWNDYKWGEILEVDGQESLRFLRRDANKIVMASVNGIKEIGAFAVLSVRRPLFETTTITQTEKEAALNGMIAAFDQRNGK